MTAYLLGVATPFLAYGAYRAYPAIKARYEAWRLHRVNR